MKYSSLRWISLVLIGLQLTGCATIYGRQNDDQQVFFESNIEGVQIYCSGKGVTTPGNISLAQVKSHSCTATSEGFENRYFTLRSGVSGEGFDYSTKVNWEKWGWWTLGLGVLAGWSVDFVSGSMKTLKQDRVYLDMRPIGTTSTSKKVLEKAKNVTRAIVKLPKQVVDETAGTVIDTTIRAGSEQIGLSSSEKREQVEAIIDGRKEAKRLEEVYGPAPAPEVE